MTVNLKNPKLYFNRELSWVKFNERVLEEAKDTSQPLLERLKFTAIFSSNLDEFFMIRVAGVQDQMDAGISEMAPDALTPEQQLAQISEEVHRQVEQQSKVLLDDILPGLRRAGIRIRNFSTLTAAQKQELKDHFKYKIFPVLTPLAIDTAHPFPQLRSLGINLLVDLKAQNSRKEAQVAVVPVPGILDRFIPLPGKDSRDFVLLEDVIKNHLEYLFPNMRILKVTEFRITRNADIEVSEAEADDLLKQIERELRKRRLGTVIRLEVSEEMSLENRNFLREMTDLRDSDIYNIEGPLDLASFMFLHGLDVPELKDPPFTPALKPRITEASDIFAAIRKHDILIHHPYQSFQHVIELVQEAARDPQVLAIKQTLYRTSGKSPIVAALKDAANNGKQVTALIELKARFDEETNIVWARELERVGVNVIYGLLGLKTHCKILLIVRQEEGEIRRYVHMGTGNYNARTARIYTDFSLLTCDPAIGKDASELFNYLTGFSGQQEWRQLVVAPVNMREILAGLINDCIKSHSDKTPSRIRMVMNSLVDPDMIQLLYKASNKGVKIDLLVRGICCLRPGVKGVSENIHVRSIVGRFLEHPRVYQFQFGGENMIYMGSADLMQRNLNRRVELCFPVNDPLLLERVVKVLDIQFADNVKARLLDEDGNYHRAVRKPGEAEVHSQQIFLDMAMATQREIDTLQG
jgi:polyphosphate kinase